MQQIKFIKDHPSRRFKKGDLINMPTENVDAWLKSGYAVVPKENTGDDLGNLPTSSKGGGKLKVNSDKPLKSGKPKKKNRKNK